MKIYLQITQRCLRAQRLHRGPQPRTFASVPKKTKGVEYMPMSEQAYALCGERGDDDRPVFEDLQKISWISRPLKKWIQAASIKRNITFHCFRYTYATLQLANGTDIYTVSKMLGHTNVRTTQIYAKVVDPLKQAAANAIKIKFDENDGS